jgi:hypothetical protein
MRPPLNPSMSSDTISTVCSFDAAEDGSRLGYAGPDPRTLPDSRAPLKVYMKATRQGVSEDELPDVPFLKAAPSESLAGTSASTRTHIDLVMSVRPAVLTASSGRVRKSKKPMISLPEHLTPSNNENHLDSIRYEPKPTSARPSGFESFPPPQLPSSPVEELDE